MIDPVVCLTTVSLADGAWWGKTQPIASWSPSAGTATSPLALTVPPVPTPTELTPTNGGSLVGQVRSYGVGDRRREPVAGTADNRVWRDQRLGQQQQCLHPSAHRATTCCS